MILTYAGRKPAISQSAFIAPSAEVIGSVEVGDNASIWFQCVLRGDIEPIRVGACSNVQDGSVVHTIEGSPAMIGDWVTVGHCAVIHGATVESHCLVGMGAILLNGVRVGEGSIVAAGAVVAEGTVIPPASLYMGVPARFKRQLDAASRAFIDAHAQHYIDLRRAYLPSAT